MKFYGQKCFFLKFLNKPMETESDFRGLNILQLSPLRINKCVP